MEFFALYSFYESNGRCTQKMISEKWNIPKQTVNTILKDFQKKDTSIWYLMIQTREIS